MKITLINGFVVVTFVFFQLFHLTSSLQLGGVANAASTSSPTNEELKVGISQEFETLNPINAQMVASFYLLAMVNRLAVYLDANGSWSPQLMKKIPSLENKLATFVTLGSERGLVTQWEVIENAKWGDGVPVTCEDFEFAWQVGLNENVSVGSREIYSNIEKFDIDVKNPKKCAVTFKKAKFDFYQNLPKPIPKHLEEPVLKKYGSQNQGYDRNSIYVKEPTNKGLYNGPYLISELKLGSHVVMVPNPYFYGAPPKIKKIIIKKIDNTATLEANLLSGQIDMICSLGLSFDQGVTLEKKVEQQKLPFKVIFQPSSTYEHIDLALDNPILSDIRVRKALVHAFNRELISKSLFSGKQPAAVHHLAPFDPNFTNDSKKIVIYKNDKKEAAKLLDEAGWKLEGDYRYRNGERLSLAFATTAGNKTRENVQNMIKEQLKSVGVEVVTKNEAPRTFFDQTMKQRKFNGLAMYAWVSTPDMTSRTTMHSKMIPSKETSWSGQNFPGWRNSVTDSLIDQFESEFSASKRKAITHKILKEYTNDVPVIPLYYRSDLAVVPIKLNGFKLTGHQYFDSNAVENWSLDK